MTAKKWCAPLENRPLWADVVDEMIRVSSKNPDDPRKSSILSQTWRETSGKTSTLPRDVQAMLKELRRYDVRVEALKFGSNVKDEMPVWLSRTTDLTLKEENSAAMRHLRKTHRISTLGDLRRIQRFSTDGCKKHTKCVEAVDLILQRTSPPVNIRFQTPFLQGETQPDNLDFTQRRTTKATEDVEAGRPTLLNPKVTHDGSLRDAIRVFGQPRAKELLPAYREGLAKHPAAHITVWTDGSTTDFGTATQKIGFGVWSEDETIEISSALHSDQATNNLAELMAVVVALDRVPRNVNILVNTDSQYVVTGLTRTAKSWEDEGWLGVQNADAWKKLLHLVRTRTAETTVAKVEAHSGIYGNDKADELAKTGAEGVLEVVPDLLVPERWQLQGAKISALTYRTTYEWVRTREVKGKRPSAPANLDRVKDTLEEVHAIRTTDPKIWLGLRKPYIRREIADFLWIAIHGRTQCGSMFSKWGGEWEDLQYCSCGAIETLEHILFTCEDMDWRDHLWSEMAKLLRVSGMIPTQHCRTPYYGEVLGIGAMAMGNATATRLWATIVSETAFTIWKLRNRARFDEIRITQRMAKDIWRATLEKRAKTDLAAIKLKGPTTAPETKRREEAVTAWRSVLSFQGSVTVWNSADYG